MKHMRPGGNICLVTCRQSAVDSWEHVFISGGIVDDSYISNRTKERSYCYPLYIYPDDQDIDKSPRINFNDKLFSKLVSDATHPEHGEPDEIQVFDYVYGVLHCPNYREFYAEHLKAGFPRIPWPVNANEFWDVSQKGTQLRKLHLMDPAAIGNTSYPLRGAGNTLVDVPEFRDNQIWINNSQYFEAVSESAWSFRIGGYQPAKKWLKDRIGKNLSYGDVKHYQRMLKVLSETDRIMATIEMTLSD